MSGSQPVPVPPTEPRRCRCRLAFCLYAVRPFGGLQNDFMRIATECLRRGHSIKVYTMYWIGSVPDGFQVEALHPRGFSAATRNRRFLSSLHRRFASGGHDLVIGFDRLPGVDVYFAADSCFQAKVARRRGGWYRLTPRYRQMVAFEQGIYAAGAGTEILMLTEQEIATFRRYYATPAQRFHLLPPGISRDRMRPADAGSIRAEVRAEYGLEAGDHLLLAVGSGFRTKGLDRSLRALAALPERLRSRTRLLVIGKDKQRPFERLAARLGVASQVWFAGGRDDVSRFLLAADLLLHPAYSEAAGMVLLEAMVAGLPVLTTAVCGYSFHVRRAGAGVVLEEPFSQLRLNQSLREMLAPEQDVQWRSNGVNYGRNEDLYSLPQRAADLIERFAECQP